MPAVRGSLTNKIYVDQALSYWLDQLSSLRLNPDEKLILDKQYSIILKSTLTSPKTLTEKPNKSYVDSLHENTRNRRHLSSVFNDQDNKFDKNKLNNLDSVTVKRNLILDNELSTKKQIDDSIGEGTLLRFIKH